MSRRTAGPGTGSTGLCTPTAVGKAAGQRSCPAGTAASAAAAAAAAAAFVAGTAAILIAGTTIRSRPGFAQISLIPC